MFTFQTEEVLIHPGHNWLNNAASRAELWKCGPGGEMLRYWLTGSLWFEVLRQGRAWRFLGKNSPGQFLTGWTG